MAVRTADRICAIIRAVPYLTGPIADPMIHGDGDAIPHHPGSRASAALGGRRSVARSLRVEANGPDRLGKLLHYGHVLLHGDGPALHLCRRGRTGEPR